MHILQVVAVTHLAGLIGLALVLAVLRPDLPDRNDIVGSALLGGVSIVAAIFFYTALARGPVSIMAPLLATSAAIPVLYGLARGERPSAVQWIGMAACTVGCVLASIHPGEGAAERAHHRGRTLAIGVVALILTGVYLIVIADLVERASAAWILGVSRATSTTVLCTTVVALMLVGRLGLPRRRPVLGAAAVGLIDPAANGSFAVATTMIAIGPASVLSSLFPIVTVALAHVVLHERIIGAQRAGVVVALIGVPLVAGG